MNTLATNVRDEPSDLVTLPRFQTKSGQQTVDLKDILYLSGKGNYTVFHLRQEVQILTSLSLGVYASLLEPQGFIRLHKSCLFNEHYLNQCQFQRYNELTLSTGIKIKVSRRRRTSLKKAVSLIEEAVA